MTNEDKAFRVLTAIAIAALLAIAGSVAYSKFVVLDPVRVQIPYSQFAIDLDQGHVKAVQIEGQKVFGQLDDKSYFRTVAPADPSLLPSLKAKGVFIRVKETPAAGAASPWTTWAPLLIFAVLGVATFWFMRRTPLFSGGADSKSRARRMAEAQAKVTFADVAGVDEARESLQEIVDFLKEGSKFQTLGGRIPTGVLLVGPPGAGKTLLARAIAGEAGVPFFSISGSEFVERYVGVGAARIRALFDEAKKNAPCIVFMDEIDAVGRKRGAGVGQGNDEQEQTLNQLLVEMDGFASSETVILIAATNRPDMLDPALLRPGRFDREIVVSKPDVLGREQILAVHTGRTPLAADVDLRVLARRTPGFSGADLMNLVNEAALLAARRQRASLSMREFNDAKDTVTMGVERRTYIMTEEERRLTAYREGGRVVVALNSPAADPIHKATIIPRGRSVGSVKQIAADDQRAETLEQMKSRLAILLAGRVAEEMTFGRDKTTSATAGDIDEATKLARAMVTRYGLSEKLGTMAYEDNQEEVFLGHSVARQQTLSEETAQAITLEVRALLDAAAAAARGVLTRHHKDLETVAQGLLLYESLSGEDIASLIAGKVPAKIQDLAP